MSQAPAPERRSRRRIAGPVFGLGSLVILGLSVLGLWLGGSAIARSGQKAGGVLVLASLSMAALACGGLAFATHSWRLRRAVRRFGAGPGGREPLGSWPGLRERKSRLTVRSGHLALRFWVLPVGLGLSAGALQWLGGPRFSVDELVLGLAPAVVLTLLAEAWGPSGWKLVLDSARQSLELERFGPFRRIRDAAASLPTVQAARFTDDGRGHSLLTVQLTRGMDWQLDLPADWPPELGRVLASRLAHLVGIEEEKVP